MDSVQHERRFHPRYTVKNGTLLYNESIFAEIINISKGGICCKFLTDRREQLGPVNLVDLINTPARTCLQAIPCADLNFHDPASIVHLPMAPVRESRLQFAPKDTSQLTELHSFIDSIIAEPI